MLEKTASLKDPVLSMPRLDEDAHAQLILLARAVDQIGPVQLAHSDLPDDLLAVLSSVGHRAEIARLTRELDTTRGSVHRPYQSELSPREFEVMTRLMGGDRVPAIAAALFLTPSTVRNHLASLFRKLGVRSQQGLLDALRAL